MYLIGLYVVTVKPGQVIKIWYRKY